MIKLGSHLFKLIENGKSKNILEPNINIDIYQMPAETNYLNSRYCSHVLKYEKKSNKITWLRCMNCNSVIGWLEDDRKKIEGKVVRLSQRDKELLR